MAANDAGRSADSPPPEGTPGPKPRRLFLRILGFLGQQLFPLLVIVWANGLLVRVTVRDSVDLLAPLYYATPWPVLAVLTLPFLWTVRRQPKMVGGVLVLAHLFGAAWILEDWRSGEPSKEPADLRVVQWNVARPARWIPPIAQRLRDYDADILAVSEPLPRHSRDPVHWIEAFPGYTGRFAPGNMLCLIRGELTGQQFGTFGPGSYYALYEARIRERDVRILQIDGNGDPRASRKPMTELAKLADTWRDRPLIVLGDFNVPRDSVHLAGLRQHFSNTFEMAGLGCGATWPFPLPVLSLDQIWYGPGLQAVRCRHEVSFRSDHRPVVAELKFAAPEK